MRALGPSSSSPPSGRRSQSLRPSPRSPLPAPRGITARLDDSDAVVCLPSLRDDDDDGPNALMLDAPPLRCATAPRGGISSCRTAGGCIGPLSPGVGRRTRDDDAAYGDKLDPDDIPRSFLDDRDEEGTPLEMYDMIKPPSSVVALASEAAKRISARIFSPTAPAIFFISAACILSLAALASSFSLRRAFLAFFLGDDPPPPPPPRRLRGRVRPPPRKMNATPRTVRTTTNRRPRRSKRRRRKKNRRRRRRNRPSRDSSKKSIGRGPPRSPPAASPPRSTARWWEGGGSCYSKQKYSNSPVINNS